MPKSIRDRVLLHLDEVLGSPALVTHPRCAALLRYLVEQSLAGKTPHEIDIAVDVFGRTDGYDSTENSSVRVCVHQLRKMLRDYYQQSNVRGEVSLSIPKGSYRVSFGVPLIAEPNAPAAAGRWLPLLEAHRVRVLVALLVASLVGNLLFLLQQRGDDLADAAYASQPRLLFSGDMAEGTEPILIVLGDFFFFQQGGSDTGWPRFVRQIDINSADDLRKFAGDEYGVTVVPSQRSYLPKAAAVALETLLPLANATGRSVSLKLMSDVNGEDLRDNDVIYVGYLRSMGPLRDFFFRSSNFCSEAPFTELLHKDTGKTFARSGSPFEHVLDYGLFARMAGPGGGEMLLFTGISDVGILHTVHALTDPTSAMTVEQAVTRTLDGIPSELEILFEVSGYDRADLAGTNIAAFERLPSLRSEQASMVGANATGAAGAPVHSPCTSMQPQRAP